MIENVALHTFLNDYLQVGEFNDYCPNGLQVQGRDNIQKVVTGVTACQELLDYAVQVGADAILVHHGYFWKGEAQVVTGVKYRRLKALLQHDINLFAYHLPLDCHPLVGNNAQLAINLGITLTHGLDNHARHSIPMAGELAVALSLDDFCERVSKQLNRTPLAITGGKHPIKKIGVCTGGGQDYLELAAEMGMDAFISGEVSERTTHIAREMGIHYIAAGHHATEKDGVKTLGNLLASEYQLDVEFFDVNNPV